MSTLTPEAREVLLKWAAMQKQAGGLGAIARGGEAAWTAIKGGVGRAVEGARGLAEGVGTLTGRTVGETAGRFGKMPRSLKPGSRVTVQPVLPTHPSPAGAGVVSTPSTAAGRGRAANVVNSNIPSPQVKPPSGVTASNIPSGNAPMQRGNAPIAPVGQPTAPTQPAGVRVHRGTPTAPTVQAGQSTAPLGPLGEPTPIGELETRDLGSSGRVFHARAGTEMVPVGGHAAGVVGRFQGRLRFGDLPKHVQQEAVDRLTRMLREAGMPAHAEALQNVGVGEVGVAAREAAPLAIPPITSPTAAAKARLTRKGRVVAATNGTVIPPSGKPIPVGPGADALAAERSSLWAEQLGTAVPNGPNPLTEQRLIMDDARQRMGKYVAEQMRNRAPAKQVFTAPAGIRPNNLPTGKMSKTVEGTTVAATKSPSPSTPRGLIPTELTQEEIDIATRPQNFLSRLFRGKPPSEEISRTTLLSRAGDAVKRDVNGLTARLKKGLTQGSIESVQAVKREAVQALEAIDQHMLTLHGENWSNTVNELADLEGRFATLTTPEKRRLMELTAARNSMLAEGGDVWGSLSEDISRYQRLATEAQNREIELLNKLRVKQGLPPINFAEENVAAATGASGAAGASGAWSEKVRDFVQNYPGLSVGGAAVGGVALGGLMFGGHGNNQQGGY